MGKKVDYGLGNKSVGYMRMDFKAPRVVHPSAEHIFENARGGPYKYGHPLKATVENLRAVALDLL